jgi:3,4-dihydroxy-2-butanone 4-phosphate synthase
MSFTLVKNGIHSLKSGELIIAYDDVETQMASLVGLAEKATPQNVNMMTKIGKGLVYVCLTEDKAKQLKLPFMVRDNENHLSKSFTVSVDFKSTTTGISAFERADTIKSFTNKSIQPDEFRRPGHVFPLISKEKGLLQRIGIAEAAVDLAKMVSAAPVAYICEILNSSGEIASQEEVAKLASHHGLQIVKVSDIMDMMNGELLSSFKAKVIKGRQLGRTIGFPTANLHVDQTTINLASGVYGVKVLYNNEAFFGVMNVGVRPTFKEENPMIRYEVHILDFDKFIYDEEIKIDVCFFLREEISFPTINELISQIKEDVEFVTQRFGLLKIRKTNLPLVR